MSRYTSPVNPAVFPHLTVVLLAIGMFFTAWFFVYPAGTAPPPPGRGGGGGGGCALLCPRCRLNPPPPAAMR